MIGDAIGEAVTDCGRAWAADPERDPKILAEEVFDLFTTDEYGARSELITAFSEALGTSGLDELERLVRERLDHEATGKHVYQQMLTTALENIADARGDVDGYIAAHRLAGTEYVAVKEIGERLLAAGRLEEALHWLDRPGVPEHKRGDIGPLKVDILDRLGRTEDAQAVRWAMFATSLGTAVGRRPRRRHRSGIRCDRRHRRRRCAANAQNAAGYLQQQYNAYYAQCMASRRYPPPQYGGPAPVYAPAPGYSPMPSYGPPPGYSNSTTSNDLNRQELNRLYGPPYIRRVSEAGLASMSGMGLIRFSRDHIAQV